MSLHNGESESNIRKVQIVHVVLAATSTLLQELSSVCTKAQSSLQIYIILHKTKNRTQVLGVAILRSDKDEQGEMICDW
ncbi:hypothetical protein Scep_009566 [Stephania cephalantha]|uniref:Uncharacterized protein n=1 Tax=Stephania cephalantha TaxID=152367 RepID=A0AAP0PGB7_9MAGN